MTIEDTELHTWFERDRAHVELRNKETDETVIEFWDDDVGGLVMDGFLDPFSWKESLWDYAKDLGIITETKNKKGK